MKITASIVKGEYWETVECPACHEIHDINILDKKPKTLFGVCPNTEIILKIIVSHDKKAAKVKVAIPDA